MEKFRSHRQFVHDLLERPAQDPTHFICPLIRVIVRRERGKNISNS
jgi:hypothetical protein